MNQIPYEVLKVIFEYLDDKIKYSLVNKFWDDVVNGEFKFLTFNKIRKRFPKYQLIEKLKFVESFNEKINVFILPRCLKYLILNYSFDQSLDDLPKILTHLKVGASFTKSLDNLPPSLTHLTLKCYRNHPINKFPSSLISLILCNGNFNQTIDHLPSSLKYLDFVGNCNFDQPLVHSNNHCILQ